MKFFVVCIIIIIQFAPANAQKNEAGNLLNRVGDTVSISGKIYSGAFLTNVKTKPTFLNLGDTNPSHRLIIRIEPEDRDKFPSAPETFYLNKQVSVTGVINNYKGIALIKVSQPAMIKTGYVNDTIISSQTPASPIIKSVTAVVSSIPHNNTTVQPKAPERVLPDSLLQTNWVNSVSNKSAEQIKRNLRIVEKEMPVRISPNDDAPVIAMLNRGIVISILDKSRKWSHIIVRTLDGTKSVYGFIRNRTMRHLKKL